LANWENHRYQEEWENSLIVKNFAFQFVNAYISLFSIAFFDRDFNTLATNLGIILILKQVAINLIEFVLPKIMNKIKSKRLLNKWEVFAMKPTDLKDQEIQLEIE